MTNAEAYIGDEDLIDQFIDEFNEFACKQDCELEYHYLKEMLVKFFKQERTPILTDDERVILRSIDKTYTHISRTYGDIWVGIGKETADSECERVCVFNHLFQFIKERRRI